jgi:hypothetical protein
MVDVSPNNNSEKTPQLDILNQTTVGPKGAEIPHPVSHFVFQPSPHFSPLLGVKACYVPSRSQVQP